jgi:hypothetical protein
MIGLDTNVLARYFAQDHPLQSAQATTLIESLDEQHPGFLSRSPWQNWYGCWMLPTGAQTPIGAHHQSSCWRLKSLWKTPKAHCRLCTASLNQQQDLRIA